MSDKEDSPVKARKSRVAVLSSDDEDSAVDKNNRCENSDEKSPNKAIELSEENEELPKSVTQELEQKINESDSENEEDNHLVVTDKNKLNESENDDDKSEVSDTVQIQNSRRAAESDGSSSSEDNDKVPLACDSSEEELPDKVKQVKKKQQRSSKQIAEEKFRIHSETERLTRERTVSLPYHRPKQRSLKEFLSRKKTTYSNVSLKSSPSKLVKLLQDIEDNTKLAPQFFKSDSEEEEIKNELHIEESSVLSEKELNTDTKNVEEQVLNSIIEQIVQDVEPNNIENTPICRNTEKSENAQVLSDIITSERRNMGQETEAIEVEEDFRKEQVLGIEKAQNWLKDVMDYENEERQKCDVQRRKEKVNLLLKQKNILKITPRLSKNTDNFIDLDDTKNCKLNDGTKKLMEKFINQLALKKKKKVEKDVEIEVLSSMANPNGQVKSVQKEKFNFHYEEEFFDDNTKPGSKLQKLRMELQSKIIEKWKEESKKREVVETGEKEGYEDDHDYEAEDEDEMSVSDETDAESEPEENDVLIVDKVKSKSDFVDEEAEEDEDELDEVEDLEDDGENCNEDSDQDDNDDDDDENEGRRKQEMDDIDCSLIPPYQPGGGQLHGGSTLTQSNDLIKLPSPLYSPSIDLNDSLVKSDTVDASQFYEQQDCTPKNVRKTLFEVETDRNNLEDAFDLCSGQFPDSQSPDVLQTSNNVKSSTSSVADHMRVLLGDKPTTEDDVFDLISGKFDSQDSLVLTTDSPADKRLELEESDVEQESEVNKDVELEEPDQQQQTCNVIYSSDEENGDKFEVGVRKKKKLCFSDEENDDENDENDGDDGGKSDEDDEKEDEGEIANGDVEYDSEENEIVRDPNQFFEQEAELSESEWSGDEDEKGLDVLDAEAGDADVFDQEQVKEQLGKIHMRRVLDEDNRDVKMLQELLLEDGDLHEDGRGRERKFRWKNIDNFENDENRRLEPGGESDGDEDEQHDEEWRKSRHEREIFLRNHEQQTGESVEDDDPFLKLGKEVLDKVNNMKTQGQVKKNDVLLSPDVKKNLFVGIKRGSFLSRDERFLSSLAKATCNVSNNVNAPKHSKNFVFAVKSPGKDSIMPKPTKIYKRKADESTPPVMKRLKKIEENFKSRRSLSLFDQMI